MKPLTRRNFLKLSTATGLLAAGSAGLSTLRATTTPFERKGSSRLRISVDAFSFRESYSQERMSAVIKAKMGKANPAGQTYDLFQFIDYCVTLGADGVHLVSYFFASEADDYFVKLKRHAFLRGLPISGIAHGTNASFPPGPDREREIADLKKTIDRASLVGAGYVRAFVGTSDLPREEADRQAIALYEECGEYAGRRGIFIGLENHDVSNVPRLVPIIKKVKSPWVGVSLDSSGVAAGDEQIEMCLPYLVGVTLRADQADYTRYARLLRTAGYQGWVVLKYEGNGSADASLSRAIRVARDAFSTG